MYKLSSRVAKAVRILDLHKFTVYNAKTGVELGPKDVATAVHTFVAGFDNRGPYSFVDPNDNMRIYMMEADENKIPAIREIFWNPMYRLPNSDRMWERSFKRIYEGSPTTLAELTLGEANILFNRAGFRVEPAHNAPPPTTSNLSLNIKMARAIRKMIRRV